MKRILSMGLALLMLLSAVCIPVSASTPESHTYDHEGYIRPGDKFRPYDAIAAAGAAGWIHGYEDGTFRPNQSVKRIEAVKMINNMLGWSCDRDFVDNETHLSGFEFEDLERGSWEYYEVMEASLSHNCIHENGKEIWTKAAVAA